MGRCGFGGHFGAFRRVAGPTVGPHVAILEIPLGGEGQPVAGLGATDQLGISRADSATLRRECVSTPPIPGALLLDGAASFETYSKNLNTAFRLLEVTDDSVVRVR